MARSRQSPRALSDDDRRACRTELLRVGADVAARLERLMAGKEVSLADLAFPPNLAKLRREDRLRQYLAKIDGAIKRLDRGEFGSCTGCGAPVGAATLRAAPWTAECEACT